MRQIQRKSAPQVIKGKVQKKNNWRWSENYYYAPAPHTVVIDRQRPGDGYRHLLLKSDIYRFLEILPDWNQLAVGLNAIVLAPGSYYKDGYHVPGVVHICAWEAELWRTTSKGYYEDHKDIFERIGVTSEETEEGDYLCKFDTSAVRAYQLLHILLHELGHHHDRMTTRSQRRASRGESYAEEYARQYDIAIWQQYLQTERRKR